MKRKPRRSWAERGGTKRAIVEKGGTQTNAIACTREVEALRKSKERARTKGRMRGKEVSRYNMN